MNEPELDHPVTMVPRARCSECGRRRVLKDGRCSDCRESAQDALREAVFGHYVRLDAGQTYRQWVQQYGPAFEVVMRRAYLDGNLTEFVEWAFKHAFEEGVMAYPGIVNKLEHDLEEV